MSLATPLLLLGADLRRIFRDTSRLLGIFCLGSLATAVAATVSFYLFAGPMGDLGALVDGGVNNGDGWKARPDRLLMVYQRICTHSPHPPPWPGHSFPLPAQLKHLHGLLSGVRSKR